MNVLDIKKMEKRGILGQFFHSVSKDKQLLEQGVVLSNPEPGWYYLQLFEWGFGEANVRKLEKIENMANWLFYEDANAMKYSYEYGAARENGPYRKN
jgi:hypothetical protein